MIHRRRRKLLLALWPQKGARLCGVSLSPASSPSLPPLLPLTSPLASGRQGMRGEGIRPPRSLSVQLGPRRLPRPSPCPRACGGCHSSSSSAVLAVGCPPRARGNPRSGPRSSPPRPHSNRVLFLGVLRRRKLMRVVMLRRWRKLAQTRPLPLLRRRKLMRVQQPRRRRKLMRCLLTNGVGATGPGTFSCACGRSTRSPMIVGQPTI